MAVAKPFWFLSKNNISNGSIFHYAQIHYNVHDLKTPPVTSGNMQKCHQNDRYLLALHYAKLHYIICW
jgi:hypothetical protein